MRVPMARSAAADRPNIEWKESLKWEGDENPASTDAVVRSLPRATASPRHGFADVQHPSPQAVPPEARTRFGGEQVQKSRRRQVDGSGEVGCCDNGARFLADDAYGRTDALVDLPRLGAAQRLPPRHRDVPPIRRYEVHARRWP